MNGSRFELAIIIAVIASYVRAGQRRSDGQLQSVHSADGGVGSFEGTASEVVAGSCSAAQRWSPLVLSILP